MRCYKCMEDVMEGKCSKCGCDMNPEPIRESHLKPGTVLNERYYIGYARKQTAVFITYLAWDLSEQKSVYINEYFPKELACRVADEDTVKEMVTDDKSGYMKNGLNAFRDECADLCQLDNVDVIGYFEANDTCYAVRKIMSGLSVASLINGEYEITDDYAKRILILLLRTLHKVNKLGIIHGNIKPETIYFNEDTSVTVTDFSFCGYLSRVVGVSCNEGFSPAEQYEVGSKLTTAVDVYSAAAVFYELLTEKMPPLATDRIHQETLIAPSVRGIKIRKGMENALLNALNIRPENRTQSVNEFYAELKDKNTKRNWERSSPKPVINEAKETGKTNWPVIVACIIGIALLVAVIVVGIEIKNMGEKNDSSMDLNKKAAETQTLFASEQSTNALAEANTQLQTVQIESVTAAEEPTTKTDENSETTTVKEKTSETTTLYNSAIKPLENAPNVVVEKPDGTNNITDAVASEAAAHTR